MNGIEGEIVLIKNKYTGEMDTPAMVISDDIDRLYVRVLGAHGGRWSVPTEDCRLVVENDG